MRALDGSSVAVKCAPRLAKGNRLNISFFRSSWKDLGVRCKRTYDFVINDYFYERDRSAQKMRDTARGIYSVLDKGGKFVFGSLTPKDLKRSDLKRLIEGVVRAEIALIMNLRIKWIFQDYVKLLREAGFRRVDCIIEGGTIFHMGVK